MVEMRRKNKPAPTEIQPPTNPEEWIERANADGETPSAPDQTAISPKQPKAKAGDQKQQKQEIPSKAIHSIPGNTASGSEASHYISFAIDTITLNLFRELCFTLNKGNTATLSHIIETCAQMGDEEYLQFPEWRVISGSSKRTMSFLLPQSTIDNLQSLAYRLRFRNKSALNRYLIQLSARKAGIDFKSAG